jgi:hypothetical protein
LGQAARVKLKPTDVLPWLVRAIWVALPFAAGPALAAALDPRSAAVRATASAGLWLGWALGLVAVLVAHPLSLTVLRVLAPAGLASVGLAALGSTVDAVPLLLALTASTVATALALLPETGTWLVNGGAYGNERRHLLRPPRTLFAGPIPLAWLALVAGVAGGPLLLAAQRWVVGALALVVGVPVALVAARALHSLTQRWAVLVPAGLVLKDHLAVADPVLLRRVDIELLRAAPPGTDALDLTAGASGLALEARLREAVPLVRVVLGRRPDEPGRSAALRFTPTRPGAVLDEARARRIPVAR